MKTCSYCGKQYPDDATVCPADGETLPGSFEDRKKVTGVWRGIYGYGQRGEQPGLGPVAFTLKLKQGWLAHFDGSVTEDAPQGNPYAGTVDGYFNSPNSPLMNGVFQKHVDGMNTAGCHNTCQEQHSRMQQPPDVSIRCIKSHRGYQCPYSPKHQKQAPHPRFGAPRLAHAPNFPQQQAQIIGRTLECMRLADIGLAAQPTPPSAARLADMGKGSFAPFTTPAIQLSPLVILQVC